MHALQYPIAQLPAPLDGGKDSIRNGRSTLAPSLRKPLFEQAVSFGYQPDGQLSMVWYPNIPKLQALFTIVMSSRSCPFRSACS